VVILAQILIAKSKTLQIIFEGIWHVPQVLVLAACVVEGGAHYLNKFIKFFIFFRSLCIRFLSEKFFQNFICFLSVRQRNFMLSHGTVERAEVDERGGQLTVIF
jgi:hypothetical protein